MLHSKTFIWNDQAQNSFDQFKAHLTQAPISAYLNYNYLFIIHTDASDNGIGAVFSQHIDGKEFVI